MHACKRSKRKTCLVRFQIIIIYSNERKRCVQLSAQNVISNFRKPRSAIKPDWKSNLGQIKYWRYLYSRRVGSTALSVIANWKQKTYWSKYCEPLAALILISYASWRQMYQSEYNCLRYKTELFAQTWSHSQFLISFYFRSFDSNRNSMMIYLCKQFAQLSSDNPVCRGGN